MDVVAIKATFYKYNDEKDPLTITDIEWLELTRPKDTQHISDVFERYTVEDELRNNEEVMALQEGHYEIMIFGQWYWDMQLDWETGKPDSAEVIFEIDKYYISHCKE